MKYILVLMLGFLFMGLAGAVTLETGVSFALDNTTYVIGEEINTSGDVILHAGNLLQLGSAFNLSITPDNGSLTTSVFTFNNQKFNFTHQPTANTTVTHNLTGFQASFPYAVRKNGTSVDTDISSASGHIDYLSERFINRKEYVFLATDVLGNCSVQAGMDLLSFDDFNTYHEMVVNNTNRSLKRINCTLDSLETDCNWGAGNVSQIITPVANITVTPFTSCNVTLVSKRAVGEYFINFTESQAYNQSNLGLMNFTTTKFIRRFYGWGFTQNITRR